MKPIEIIATDLFEKVRSRFTNLQLGDESGSVTADPADARFFDFDFAIEGNTLGRVSISINEIGNLKIYYSQGIMEDADGITQSMWYDFLKEMRFFAKRRLMRFDTRDITKGNLDKTDFQYLAQNGNKDPNMNESAKLTGSKLTSHRKLDNTDLIIRHSEEVDETKAGARSRKIKNLFIQNAEGERFKFPFIYLPGARAMQRHVANGGYPHDDAGKHIVKTCEEILKLSDFGRKVKHSSMNPNAHGIIEQAGNKLKKLRHHMECMGKQGYYESWKETYAPADSNLIELDAATMESYKDAFTVNKFDEALAEVFPLLHSIMQEAGEIDLDAVVSESQDEEIELAEEDTDESMEFAAFESWATALESGSIEPDALMTLKQFLDENPGQTLGADGTEAIEALEGIGIVSNALEDLIHAKVQMQDGANIPLVDVIKEYLMQDDPEAAAELFPQQAPQQVAPTQEPAMAEDGPNKTDVPAYLRKQKGGDWKATTADLEKEKSAGKISHRDTLAKNTNEDSVSEGAYQDLGDHGREIYTKVQGLRDKIRSGKVSVNDELADKFSDLLVGAGLDPEFAEKEWNRITGKKDEPIVDPKLRQQAPEMDPTIGADNSEDDDAEFLSRLRGQARSGSIKTGVDTGGVDEDDIEPEGNPLIEKNSSAKEIAEIVMGFYDREKGTWTKGETGVVTHVKRQFSDDDGNGGEKEAELATQLIKHLNAKHESVQQFAEMRRLAGLPELSEAAKKSMSRAAKGNEKYGKDGMKALAKAGREGASEKTLDAIRDKHDNYNEDTKSEKFDALKHVKNPTAGEKKAAKDVKRGSYADRAAMLKSAETDGRLKK